MSELNPGQQRKIRIIQKAFGPQWDELFPGMAIDAIYNKAINDDRKSLFCKISPTKKDKLDEMLDHYDTTIGDFIGMLIDNMYDRYSEQQQSILTGIANEYSGT